MSLSDSSPFLSSNQTLESSLRIAGSNDSLALALLHAACFPDAAWSATTIHDILSGCGGCGVLAEAPPLATPVGFVLCRTILDEAEILSFGVAPPWRRFGLGRRLLTAAQHMATTTGATALFLEVAEDNHPAQNLYRQNGFFRVGRRPDYYRHGGASVAALILKRTLLE
ncbi:(ribosomal protein S18)-alanine N-acetyltransferase [Azospirillaceae bacterium]